MQTSTASPKKAKQKFPPFDLGRLLKTVFEPKKGEKICILIDLEDPADVAQFAFLKNPKLTVQKKAYEVFYQEILKNLKQKFGFASCDFYAYKATGGSNLELPEYAWTPEGKKVRFDKEIYPNHDIILCISTFSATAPLTATAKKYGFRGATLHGVNDIILQTGLAVDYNEVSRETEKLRLGMTRAENVDVDFSVDHHKFHLHIDLGHQEAQKSHGLCRIGPDIANLPAGEVYFVPVSAKGHFPIKFEEDGTLGLMEVEQGRVVRVSLIRGNQATINRYQDKFNSDPASGILGELGFGTQEIPYSGRDIQDEKIFGTFHLATGRNDHLKGTVTLDRFRNKLNATHDDILFSSTKTPEIHLDQVRMLRNGKTEVLIENYQPSAYLLKLLKK